MVFGQKKTVEKPKIPLQLTRFLTSLRVLDCEEVKKVMLGTTGAKSQISGLYLQFAQTLGTNSVIYPFYFCGKLQIMKIASILSKL